MKIPAQQAELPQVIGDVFAHVVTVPVERTMIFASASSVGSSALRLLLRASRFFFGRLLIRRKLHHPATGIFAGRCQAESRRAT